MEAKFTHLSTLHETFDSPHQIIPFLEETINPKSVLDAGCGLGAWLKTFQERGVNDIIGLDGEWVNKENLLIPEENFIQTELTKPFDLGRKFDLAISLEVAEHLPKESASNFVKSLTQHSNWILFSAAIPNQRGLNHINEQPHEYWIDLFKENGFNVIDEIRWKFWENPQVRYWYKQNMFIFSNERQNGGGVSKTVVHPDLFNKRMKLLAEYESQLQGNLPIKSAFGVLTRSVLKKLNLSK